MTGLLADQATAAGVPASVNVSAAKRETAARWLVALIALTNQYSYR